MARCINCGKESRLISKPLEVCLDCIRDDFAKVLPHIREVHNRTRQRFGLPLSPPKDEHGIKCDLCVNECQIPLGKTGYCGLRKNENGKLMDGGREDGNLSWYYDGLPTNCVADWVCAGGTGCGYPDFSYSKGAEYGYKNLAVFYQACSFNCLFCQNWHYKKEGFSSEKTSSSGLASAVDSKTSCICYFGGDPAPQIIHALESSRLALKINKDRILRICWETNGAENQKYLKKMAELSLNSGGCIKFDLKTYNENLNIALCGITNKRTLENFKFLAEFIKERPKPPFLIASTLLVPGYIDKKEVSLIAKFIANLNIGIPYSLLAFYPCFYLNDLPTTSRRYTFECKEVVLSSGLKNVRIGNSHLLGEDY